MALFGTIYLEETEVSKRKPWCDDISLQCVWQYLQAGLILCLHAMSAVWNSMLATLNLGIVLESPGWPITQVIQISK